MLDYMAFVTQERLTKSAADEVAAALSVIEDVGQVSVADQKSPRTDFGARL